MVVSAKVRGERLELGLGGVYADPAIAGVRTDGTRLLLRDGELAEKSLLEMWNHVGTHGILDHPDTLDLMLDYLLKTEFYSLLEDDEHPVPIGLGGDVGGNRLLSGHVGDSSIHQKALANTIRVGTGGDFAGVQSAVNSIQDDTALTVISVGPGIIDEPIVLNKRNVTLRGAGRDATVLHQARYLYPTLDVVADNCAVENLTVRNLHTNPAQWALACRVGNAAPWVTSFRARGCRLQSLGGDTFFSQSAAITAELTDCDISGGFDVVSAGPTGLLRLRNCHVSSTSGADVLFWAYGAVLEILGGVARGTKLFNLTNSIVRVLNLACPEMTSDSDPVVAAGGSNTIYTFGSGFPTRTTFGNVTFIPLIQGPAKIFGQTRVIGAPSRDEPLFLGERTGSQDGATIASAMLHLVDDACRDPGESNVFPLVRLERGVNALNDGPMLEVINRNGVLKAAISESGEFSGVWNGTAVGGAFGGTGMTGYTKGDLIAATGASALGKVAVGADGASVVADSSQATGLGYAERSRLIYVNTANSSQLANFGVWTNFDLGVELPANFWAVGRTLEVTAQGVYSTAVAASIQLGLYLGSTKVSQFGSQSTSNGWSAINWLYRIVLVCRAVGSSGVVAFSWGLHCPYGFAAGTAGDISVNLTSALWLRPAFYCSVADAGNTATCRHFAVLRA
jgi:hypothetical protein